MKKSIYLFVALVLMLTVVCLAACNGDNTPAETTAADTTAAVTDAETVDETTDAATEPETVADTEPETTTKTETVTTAEAETQDPAELESLRAADLEYLSSVTYMDFELTGENAPYYVGRWFEKQVNGKPHIVTTTDGSHMYLMVEGATSITISFTYIHTTYMPYYAYSIDGGEMNRNPISNRRINLPDKGRHIICIVADGLYGGENKWSNEEGFAIKEITSKGRIVGIKPTAPVVFFYGDSITEGSVALGLEQSGLNNSAVNAYPWPTAKELGAVPYYIGYSSSGMIQTGSFNSCINAIDKLSQYRPLESSSIANITPDLIVINHGVNDVYDNRNTVSNTITAIKATLTRLQEKYPGVKIIYVVPFWEGQEAPVAELGRELDKLVDQYDELYVVHTKDWNITYTDGIHPNAAGAVKIGEYLSEAIVGIVGEDFFA